MCLTSCVSVDTHSPAHYSSPLHESLRVDFEENDMAESEIVSVCRPYEELFTLNLISTLLGFEPKAE